MAQSSDAIEQARQKGLEIKKEVDRKSRIYTRASGKLQLGYSEEALREAADLFSQIPGWRDADAKQKEALKKADELYHEKVYKNAVRLAESGDAASLAEAIDKMKKISDWRDAVSKAEEYELAFAEIKKKELKSRENREKTEENRKRYAETYAELLDRKDDAEIGLSGIERNLLMLRSGRTPGLRVALSIVSLLISLVCYNQYWDTKWTVLTGLGIFFGPLMIAAFIVEAIIHAVRLAKLEEKREELERELRKIDAIPSFEEYNAEQLKKEDEAVRE